MDEFTTHIKSKNGLLEINIKELFHYKDLILLFFKRNYTTRYKQTILGPLWLILNPLMTVCLYAFVFGNLAGLASDSVPHIVFYLCSNAIWSFFSTSLIQTSNTFIANASIMSKVYFPRLVMPISAVLTGILDLFIQLCMLIIIIIGYVFSGYHFQSSAYILFVPILIIQVGILGLGCGIIIAALTTKYRDLAILVGFGVQLWMYASPVVYTIELIPPKYMWLYMINPMAPIMECWRKAILGYGTFLWNNWFVSLLLTIIILLFGVILFNRVEKTFMDTV